MCHEMDYVCKVTESRADRRSSIKSLQLSTPTESRINESSIPNLIRSLSGTDACVIRDGHSANDSTAPSDSANAKTDSYEMETKGEI
jgi:hypothetical protein